MVRVLSKEGETREVDTENGGWCIEMFMLKGNGCRGTKVTRGQLVRLKETTRVMEGLIRGVTWL